MKKISRNSQRPGRPDEPVVLDNWRARAEQALAREHALRVKWVDLAALAAVFRPVVEDLATITKRWPAELARRAAETPREHPLRLAWADSPRVPRPVDQAIRDADALERAALEATPPCIRPLLQTLSQRLARSPRMRALARVLEAPRPPRRPPAAATSASARRQYLAANSRLMRSRTRLHLSRGNQAVRRDRAAAACLEAVTTFRQGWMDVHGELARHAGDGPGALVAVEKRRANLFAELGTLAGVLPARAPRKARLLRKVVYR